MSMNFCCPRFNTLVVSQSGCKYTSLFFSHPNLLPTFFEEKLTREITCWKPTHCQRQKKGGNKITIFSPSHQRLLIIFFFHSKTSGPRQNQTEEERLDTAKFGQQMRVEGFLQSNNLHVLSWDQTQTLDLNQTF